MKLTNLGLGERSFRFKEQISQLYGNLVGRFRFLWVKEMSSASNMLVPNHRKNVRMIDAIATINITSGIVAFIHAQVWLAKEAVIKSQCLTQL